MSFLDLMLNWIGVLLWLNWRSSAPITPFHAPATTLLSTLKPTTTENVKKTSSLIILILLVLLRPFLYQYLGVYYDWVPSLSFGPVVLNFRSDYLSRMFVYSVLGLAKTMGIIYIWALFLSVFPPLKKSNDFLSRIVKVLLGALDKLPFLIKVILPFFVGVLVWIILTWALASLDIIPRVTTFKLVFQQAILFGVEVYLSLEFLLVFLFFLHLLNMYVYLGNATFWWVINSIAEICLTPIRWLPLQIARLDFTPVAGIALVIAISEFGSWLLAWVYQKLPLG
jgi:uncharacterized protein YggT (Ycf19 family)